MSVSPDNASVFFKVLPGETLPIFTGRLDGLTLFYAPGYLAAARETEAEEIRMILAGEIPFGNLLAANLIDAAVSAQSVRAMQQDPEHYRPTCLTVYSSLACNLNCSYCFSSGARDAHLQLDAGFIYDSAAGILANCREMDEPFTVVFHGGGEPSLDPRLPDLLTKLQRMSAAADVPFRSYIATNGVMDEDKAGWIAENIDAIGLSVDGPPELQNRQRPLRNGDGSAPFIERTAAVLRGCGKKLTVRVTILPENFRRMGEIAGYLSEILHADEIHIEPVYERGSEPDAEFADLFCENYLNLKKQMGRRLSFSGSRIGEIHGRYCQIFRKVLHLVPPGGQSACFALSSCEEAESNGLLMDEADTCRLFGLLSAEDPGCKDCFNRYHCAGGCPDVCPASDPKLRDAGSFRCRISRKLAEAELLETAKRSLFGIARQYGYAGMDLRGE